MKYLNQTHLKKKGLSKASCTPYAEVNKKGIKSKVKKFKKGCNAEEGGIQAKESQNLFLKNI